MDTFEQMQRDSALACLEFWVNLAAENMACLDKYNSGYAQNTIANAKGALSAMRWTMLLDANVLEFWSDVLSEWHTRAVHAEFGVEYDS